MMILKTSQALFSKELTEPEFAFWASILYECTVNELRYAFDNWNRNGRFFPKPKDISDLVEAYRDGLKDRWKPCGECDEGWIKVHEGRTAGGHEVDSKMGAMVRCQCFLRHKAWMDQGCSRLCEARHGKGYHTNDIRWLLARYLKMKSSLPNRPMTDQEIDRLLNELDQKRGSKPAWRA